MRLEQAATLADAADLATLRLTVIGIADVPLFVRLYAPLSGLTTPDRLRACARESAAGAACAVADHLPACTADPMTAARWSDVVHLIRDRSFDVAMIACRPRRRVTRALVEECCRAQTPLLLSNPTRGMTSVNRSLAERPNIAG